MICVKVPGSCANMGPGFDSIGMALNVYNEICVQTTPDRGLIINSLDGVRIPTNESNLIFKSIKEFYRELDIQENFNGLIIEQKSRIPIEKGFGSSAACIVGGVLIANELSNKKLEKAEMLSIAAKIEGHVDNVAPALMGGVVVGVMETNNGKVRTESINLDINPIMKAGLKFGAIVPDFRLTTNAARFVLPEKYSREDFAFNLSRYGLLVAAIANGDIDKFNFAMNDKAHQPYRSNIIPDFDEIMYSIKECGSRGTFLSGAGPSIFVFYDNDSFEEKMKSKLESSDNWKFEKFKVDTIGATLKT